MSKAVPDIPLEELPEKVVIPNGTSQKTLHRWDEDTPADDPQPVCSATEGRGGWRQLDTVAIHGHYTPCKYEKCFKALMDKYEG